MSNVMDLLCELVTCNVCQEVHSRVYQCPNGHVTCMDCVQNLESTSCPECRSRGGWMRNRAVEGLAEAMEADFPCDYPACPMRIRLHDVDWHRQSCAHRVFQCPATPLSCVHLTKCQLVPHLLLHRGVRSMNRDETMHCTLRLRASWRQVVIWDGRVIVLGLSPPAIINSHNPRLLVTSLHAGSIGGGGETVRMRVHNRAACGVRFQTLEVPLRENCDMGTPFACRLDVYPGAHPRVDADDCIATTAASEGYPPGLQMRHAEEEVVLLGGEAPVPSVMLAFSFYT